jgi:hypothetical protein
MGGLVKKLKKGPPGKNKLKKVLPMSPGMKKVHGAMGKNGGKPPPPQGAGAMALRQAGEPVNPGDVTLGAVAPTSAPVQIGGAGEGYSPAAYAGSAGMSGEGYGGGLPPELMVQLGMPIQAPQGAQLQNLDVQRQQAMGQAEQGAMGAMSPGASAQGGQYDPNSAPQPGAPTNPTGMMGPTPAMPALPTPGMPTAGAARASVAALRNRFGMPPQASA